MMHITAVCLDKRKIVLSLVLALCSPAVARQAPLVITDGGSHFWLPSPTPDWATEGPDEECPNGGVWVLDGVYDWIGPFVTTWERAQDEDYPILSFPNPWDGPVPVPVDKCVSRTFPTAGITDSYKESITVTTTSGSSSDIGGQAGYSTFFMISGKLGLSASVSVGLTWEHTVTIDMRETLVVPLGCTYRILGVKRTKVLSGYTPFGKQAVYHSSVDPLLHTTKDHEEGRAAGTGTKLLEAVPTLQKSCRDDLTCVGEK